MMKGTKVNAMMNNRTMILSLAAALAVLSLNLKPAVAETAADLLKRKKAEAAQKASGQPFPVKVEGTVKTEPASGTPGAPARPATAGTPPTKKADGDGCNDNSECSSNRCVPKSKADATKVCKAKPAAGGGGARRAPTTCTDAAAKRPGIAMVHGDPVWRSYKDSDVPKTAVCKSDEAVVVVGNTQYKYDQQCLDYNRAQAGTDLNTWTKTGGLYAIAANVTQVGKEIRIWCVPTDEVITQDKFGLLAQLAKQLRDINGIDWNAVRKLLEQAPEFVTKKMVEQMIESALGPTKRLLNMVAAKVDQLQERVDNLEAQSVSFEIGGYGSFAYPTAFGGGLRLALNVPFAQSLWFWQVGVGVGVGVGNRDGLTPAFMVDSSWNRYIGSRLAIGPALRFSLLQWEYTRLAALTVGPRLEVRLTGPDYRNLPADEVRERNGKVNAELVWYVAGGVGGGVTPMARQYVPGVAFDATTGLVLRVGKRHPINRSQQGTKVAMADGEPVEE